MQNLRIRDPGPVRGGGRQAISAEWANRMRDCVMALARVIPQQTRKPTEWTPKKPFEVTANGDDTVTVAPGEIMSYGDGTFGDLSIKHYSSFDGGDATVTANGVIYGEIDATLALNLVLNDTWIDSNGDSVDTYYYRLLPDTLDTITVGFATSMPSSSSVFYFEIAKVELTDGVASVTKQVLTHNPILSGLSSGP